MIFRTIRGKQAHETKLSKLTAAIEKKKEKRGQKEFTLADDIVIISSEHDVIETHGDKEALAVEIQLGPGESDAKGKIPERLVKNNLNILSKSFHE